MIKIEKTYQDITIKLEVMSAGDDLCVLITGGDKPHIGAISLYTKEDGIKTISAKNHKDYIINEMFLNNLKDDIKNNISVSCGIHLDNIKENQIISIYEICNSIFKEFKEVLS